MLYMDHCATTPPYDEVVDTVAQIMKQYYGNPSSLHRLGVEAERLITKAREVIARALDVKPGEIVFTSGGTESNNLAIKGAAHAYRRRGRHIITSMVEHASVYECCKQLEAEGYRVTYLPVDETGAVRVSDLMEAICDDTILVSIMHVNNEMGRIQPVEEIGAVLRNYPRIVFHVDAVQSVGKLKVRPAAAGIDLLSCSAHKIRGPKGVGFLYRRDGIALEPLFAGGGQEDGVRSGTENVPLIVGMAKAVRMAVERQEQAAAHLYSLREKLVRQIGDMRGLTVNGSETMGNMAPHIVNFSAPGIKPEVVVHALEQHGICISTRSACASGEQRPSRVLTAMGLSPAAAASGLRISLSADHTERDIDFFCDALKQVVAAVAEHAPEALFARESREGGPR